MNPNRTHFLCLVGLIALITGCQRQAKVQLKRDGPVGEIVAQFTNLLAGGTTMDCVGAVRALGTLAIESWDQASKETAVIALMRATHAPDTNVQNEAWLALFRQYDPLILPSWSSLAISNAAIHEFSNSEAQIRCAAATLLLRQSTRNQAAASALFSMLEHPDAAVRFQAGKALALESARDDLLKEQWQSHLHVLASSTNDDIRLDAVEQYLRVTRKQSEFSAARLEAEQALLELLHSAKVQMRRKAAGLLLREEGILRASLPLQDFIRNGLADPDPQVAASIAHFINQKAYFSAPESRPASGTLEALNRALQDSDPTVRLAALRLMSSTGNRWWSTVKRTGKKRLNGSDYESVEAILVDPTILQPLTNALHDGDWNVRREAALTIQYLPGLRELVMPTLWQVAIEGLESQRPNEKKRAIWSVMTMPNAPPRVGKLFEAALQDPNWQIRQTALEAIWGYSGLSGYRIDLRIWSAQCDDPSPAVRESAGNLLGRDATEQARGTNAFWSTIPAVVLRLVEDPFPDVSLAGLIVLRQISAATNETAVVLAARDRLHQIATGTNVCLKVQLARCYARSPGWARQPPDAERNLQILAGARESIVRRHAVAALNFLGLAIPPAVHLDSDPEVRKVAAFVFPRYPPISPTLSDSLETLLQKLKAADPVTRRKAAVGLASNEAARQKSGVAAEALKVLLETYTNAPPAEFSSINNALRNLITGPDYASLLRQVHEFAIHAILLDDPALQGGVWPLLADLGTHRRFLDEADQNVSALAAAAVRQSHAPDLLVRVSAVRLLPPLEEALIGRVGQTNAIAAFQVRKALVEALSDREPAVVIAAATPFPETHSGRSAILDRILLDSNLSDRAALFMEARLTDPQPDVRQIMAAALVTMGARQSDTNRVEKALKSWEGLFTRPERVKVFLSNISLNESIRMELPSGLYALQAVAFHSPDRAVRQLAIQTLARLLDALPQSSETPTWIFQELARSTRGWQPTADDSGLLRNSLLKIANGTNTALAEAAEKLLSRFLPAVETLPTALVAQAYSPRAAERRLAMLALVGEEQNSSDHFRDEASRLALQLTDDPDESVREAALNALSFNLFPERAGGTQTSFAIGPFIKALDDASPAVQETAFRILRANLLVLPESNLQQLALPMLKRMLTLRNAGGLYDYQRFGDLAGHVKDPPARQRILMDTQDHINRSDNDDDRSTWLQVIGKLHLAFGQPNEAAAAFQKAMRLHPNIGDQGLRDLEKALETAGRSRELALEPAPRPDYSEMRARLEALAKKQDVAQLVQVATRALDGYLPAYGGRTHITGRGEPDQVIGDTTKLLLGLRKFDALTGFLEGALKRYPESPDVAPGRAKICIAQDRNKEALALLERELGQRYWNWMALDLLRELCTQTRQMERYETLLRSLVAQHPDHHPLCRPLVEFYLKSSRTNEAQNVISAFRATIEEAVRNSGRQDSGQNPTYQRQSALSELLELVGDLDGAILSQIEANKGGRASLPYGQQRLAVLYRRAGITNAPALPAAK